MNKAKALGCVFSVAILVALIAVVLWVRLPPAEPPAAVVLQEQSNAPDESVSNAADEISAAAPPLVEAGLQRHLLSAAEPHRNQMLLMSLRDSGIDCEQIVHSQRLGEVWHADCGGAVLYAMTIDRLGRVSVRPVPYGDFRPGVMFFEC